jgi:HAE1 family hydrophobic/amphiphilic exporter-1
VTFNYVLLASQLDSFAPPIAVMASPPLVLIDVVPALLPWRSTPNVLSMVGLVMLMGLVSTNAIVLAGFADQARNGCASVPDALLQAPMGAPSSAAS